MIPSRTLGMFRIARFDFAVLASMLHFRWGNCECFPYNLKGMQERVTTSVVCDHNWWILNKVGGVDIKVRKYKDYAITLSFFCSVKIWQFCGSFSQELKLMRESVAILWLQLCLFMKNSTAFQRWRWLAAPFQSALHPQRPAAFSLGWRLLYSFPSLFFPSLSALFFFFLFLFLIGAWFSHSLLHEKDTLLCLLGQRASECCLKSQKLSWDGIIQVSHRSCYRYYGNSQVLPSLIHYI